MKIVVLSDTHTLHSKVVVPDGDILIHCGDLCGRGTMPEFTNGIEWMKSLPHKHKIYVPGNHDRFVETDPYFSKMMSDEAGIHLLIDSGVTIDGIAFWGMPYTPTFYNWSFMEDRGEPIRVHCDAIPDATDVLITHGPPFMIRDYVPSVGKNVGCEELARAVARVRPKYHVFGHIHFSRGISKDKDTTFMNASICTEEYEPTGEPLIFEY